MDLQMAVQFAEALVPQGAFEGRQPFADVAIELLDLSPKQTEQQEQEEEEDTGGFRCR